ncbi:uncharacterized protein CTRU02_202290 [Colletotrichum truncatum]|uniref:Uncharacterized protein n=1 Tax=Colletotrichum truncatum TaxID=5467 RepID=A0ACC3ZKA8_COLTU
MRRFLAAGRSVSLLRLCPQCGTVSTAPLSSGSDMAQQSQNGSARVPPIFIRQKDVDTGFNPGGD